MTGQPAAQAEAVSPPATEKASGKLLPHGCAENSSFVGCGRFCSNVFEEINWHIMFKRSHGHMYAQAVRFMRGYLAGKTHTGPKAWNVSRISMPAKDEKTMMKRNDEHESKIKMAHANISYRHCCQWLGGANLHRSPNNPKRST